MRPSHSGSHHRVWLPNTRTVTESKSITFIHEPILPDTSQKNQYLADFMNKDLPQSYKEAVKSPEAAHWIKAIQEEYATLKQTGTMQLVDLLLGKCTLGNKIVFKLKMLADGTPKQYKARVVVLGYRQHFGVPKCTGCQRERTETHVSCPSQTY